VSDVAAPLVAFDVLVLLLEAARFADAPNVAAAVLDLVAFRELFVENAFVVALDLLAFAPKLLLTALDSFAFAANALVVELDLFALTEAEDDSLAANVLLALACCILSELAVKLFDSVLLCVSVLLNADCSLAW
jgi:hypothetical protein